MKRINRIDYIVQENPTGVSETLLAEGINPSSDLEVLTKQTKQWIQMGKKDAVIKLLQIHPEKNAILSANRSDFDNYSGCGCGGKDSFDGSACPCKSSFDGSACPCKSSFSAEDESELEKMSRKELQLHYSELKRLLKQFPDDDELKKEVETVSHYLNSKKRVEKNNQSNKEQVKKRKDQPESKAVFSVTSKDLAVGSFIFGVALIISQIR